MICRKVVLKLNQSIEMTIHSFYFEFEIHLHKDDLCTLELIQKILGIGKIYLRETSCSLIVGSEKEIRIFIRNI